MKIVILNGYKNRRGAETFVEELSKRLSKKHEVKLLLGNKKNPIRWPILWRAFLDPHGIYTFKFTLKHLLTIWRQKFDIVIPINGGWQPALVRIITWLYGGKLVISGQSGIGWDDKNNLWCFPDCFVALSSYAKDWARKVNPMVKIEYIPNGVDVHKFKSQGEELNIKLKKPVIMTVAALTSEKRINLTIKAVSKIDNVSLLVVGDGEEKDKLQKLGDKLLKGRFKIIQLPYDQMPKAYRFSDLFTLVSLPQHSFEIALVEAMATNLAVIANDDPIRSEIVGDAGILLDPTNINYYSDMLKKALKTDWGNKPVIQSQKFSWDYISHKYENLFKDLTKK